MSEQTSPESQKDPAPIKHTDAERVGNEREEKEEKPSSQEPSSQDE